MDVKLFEVLDHCTCIPVMAIKLKTRNELERKLLAHAGYGPTIVQQDQYVLLLPLVGGSRQYECDPFSWGSRTREVAHKYILKNFERLTSGDVIDVSFILGETGEPRMTDLNHGLS